MSDDRLRPLANVSRRHLLSSSTDALLFRLLSDVDRLPRILLDPLDLLKLENEFDRLPTTLLDPLLLDFLDIVKDFRENPLGCLQLLSPDFSIWVKISSELEFFIQLLIISLAHFRCSLKLHR